MPINASKTALADALEALRNLVLAVGHFPGCPSLDGPPCTCGSAAKVRDAHGEGCRVLRNLGLLEGA